MALILEIAAGIVLGVFALAFLATDEGQRVAVACILAVLYGGGVLLGALGLAIVIVVFTNRNPALETAISPYYNISGLAVVGFAALAALTGFAEGWKK